MSERAPSISVIIPTRNRAELLRESLVSLVDQTLPAVDYEVIVVDDGSTDDTVRVCNAFSAEFPLRAIRIEASGIAAAKNIGVFMSGGPLVIFLDDDDVASNDLLERHVEAHRRFPEEGLAVLGFTTWGPSLKVTPVMDYVVGKGAFLFSYGDLSSGQRLDYKYFWGGRSSCKRSLLVTHGVFNQRFRFGCEDIELGYRLSGFGLEVMYEAAAVSYMNRPVTYLEFCSRCERQGQAQYRFSQLHPTSEIRAYCEIDGAEERWTEVEGQIAKLVHRVETLEVQLVVGVEGDLSDELHRLYQRTFLAFRARGILRASRQAGTSLDTSGLSNDLGGGRAVLDAELLPYFNPETHADV